MDKSYPPGTFPSKARVEELLKRYQVLIEDECVDEEGNIGMDVRLQVLSSGRWYLHTGDPSYDTDHTGYWGDGFLAPDTDCKELAKDLLDECKESWFQSH